MSGRSTFLKPEELRQELTEICGFDPQAFDRYHLERQPDGTWSVLSPTGKAVLKDEGYQIASNVCEACNEGGQGIGEAAEVERAILAKAGAA